MPQPKKGPRLGANPAHQRLMLRNLALSLFENERIRTTEAKAKMLRPFAERLITKARRGSVHHRRQVLSEIQDREIVHKLFDDIAPRFSTRPGGYTRVLKLGPRNGDGAPMAVVELVQEGAIRAAAPEEEGPTRRRARKPTRRRRRAPEAAEREDVAAEEDKGTAPAEDQTDAVEAGPEGARPGDAHAETATGTPGEAEADESDAEEPASEAAEPDDDARS